MKYIGRFNRNKCQPISGLVIRILQSEIRIIENKEEKKRFYKSLVSENQ